MCRIVAKEFITKDVVKLTFESKNIAQLALPGQFVNISTSDDTMLLKRPISICEIKGNNIIVCFKIIGKGTKKISEKKVNDTTKLFEESALWEPGRTEVVYLRVKNAGNLALKYKKA